MGCWFMKRQFQTMKCTDLQSTPVQSLSSIQKQILLSTYYQQIPLPLPVSKSQLIRNKALKALSSEMDPAEIRLIR